MVTAFLAAMVTDFHFAMVAGVSQVLPHRAAVPAVRGAAAGDHHGAVGRPDVAPTTPLPEPPQEGARGRHHHPEM